MHTDDNPAGRKRSRPVGLTCSGIPTIADQQLPHASLSGMDPPAPCDRLYDGCEGWVADPLYKLWRGFDDQLFDRLCIPMRRPQEDSSKAKMEQLLPRYAFIRKEMHELLNQLNHRDFS